MMSELKPRPFCGGEANYVADEMGPLRAGCIHCDACAPIDEWNTRTYPPEVVELVKAVKEAIEYIDMKLDVPLTLAIILDGVRGVMEPFEEIGG